MSETSDNQRRERQARSREEARTEETLEDWGRRVGRFLSAAAARAREEAEDMWAEAQSIRRGERE